MTLPAPYYQDDRVTIYHGDMFDILHDLPTCSVDAVITDPPYSSGGAFRGDRARGTAEKYVQTGTIAYRPEFAGDTRDQRSYLAWSSLWMNAARAACTPGAPIACFSDWRQLPTTTDALQAGGWIWRGIAVWSKKYGRVNPNGMSSAAEFIAWGTNGPRADADTYADAEHDYPAGMHHTQMIDMGDVDDSDVDDFAGVYEVSAPRKRDHIAQKPTEVMHWLMRTAPPAGTVLDPFIGSGTTLRAALDTGRKAIGVEKDEHSCEIAASRLAQGVLL